MEFVALLGFEVLTLDAVVAGGAETVVQKVVMVFAVRVVVVDVEVGGGKGRVAGFADEACERWLAVSNDDKKEMRGGTYIVCDSDLSDVRLAL